MHALSNSLDGQTIIIVGIILLAAYFLYLAKFLCYIPNNAVGIVEKLFSSKGSVAQGIIARNGEAGYQPWVLRGGMAFT